MRLGRPDPSLTGVAGLAGVDELVAALGVVPALDAGIGAVKSRVRGATAGQLVTGLAAAQWCGAEWLSGCDGLRADAGSALLTEAAVPASTTAGSLMRRFGPGQIAGIETGLGVVYDRWLALVPGATRAPLVTRAPRIDLDASDVEVYGRTKCRVGYTYAGVKAGRVRLASWAGAELPLAADLIAGNEDVRPDAPALLRRALAVLPAAVCARPRLRADAGYFDAALAHAARDAGVDFAIAAKRNPAAWRAYAGIEETAWRDARDMTGAQVASCDYTPAGWPEGTYTIVRRVRVDAETISADPRSRRRRTIAADQLRLALNRLVDHAWAVSFIVTDIPADDADLVGLETWFRNPGQRRGTLPGSQTRRRAVPPPLRRPHRQHGLDLGGAPRRRAQRDAHRPDRGAAPRAPPRPGAHRHPPPPPTHHPGTADPPRPRPDPTTTPQPQRGRTRPDPAARTPRPGLLTDDPLI